MVAYLLNRYVSGSTLLPQHKGMGRKHTTYAHTEGQSNQILQVINPQHAADPTAELQGPKTLCTA